MLQIVKLGSSIRTAQFITPRFLGSGSSSTGGPGNSVTLTPTIPSGVTENDFLVIIAVSYNRKATGNPVFTIATTSPWTNFVPVLGNTDLWFNSRIAHVFQRFCTGSAEAGASVSVDLHASGSSTEVSGFAVCLAYRGVRVNDPTANTNGFASGDETNQFPSMLTPEPYCLGVRYSMNGSNASISTASSGSGWSSNFASTQGPFTSATGDAYLGLQAESRLFAAEGSMGSGSVNWGAGQAFSTYGVLRPVFAGSSLAGQVFSGSGSGHGTGQGDF